MMRCDTCYHWHPIPNSDSWGECKKLGEGYHLEAYANIVLKKDNPAPIVRKATYFKTMNIFGCAYHEEK